MSNDWKERYNGKVDGINLVISHHTDYGYKVQYEYSKYHEGRLETNQHSTVIGPPASPGDIFAVQGQNKAQLEQGLLKENYFTNEQVKEILSKI